MPNLRVLVNDPAASFALEACLKAATLRAVTIKKEPGDESKSEEPANKKRRPTVSSSVDYNLKLDVKNAHKTSCTKFVVKLSTFLLNNLEDYLYENNANHLLRSCIFCLSGILSQKNRFNKTDLLNLKKVHQAVLPKEWSEVLGDVVTRLMSWPQFSDLSFVESSSKVLQTLCQALNNVDDQKSNCKKLFKAILKSFDDEKAPENPEDSKVFKSSSSVHLLETMMNTSTEKILRKIFKKYYEGNIVKFSESSKLNFSVQRLIDAMADKEIFETIFNCLSPDIAKLLQYGHTGVVFSLCKGCERLGVKQGQFIQSILKALECTGENTGKCIPAIIALAPHRIVEGHERLQVHLHGSLILQNIFQFNKPIKIVQSFLDMKPQNVAEIFCDEKGSRIADAYLQSKFIGEKSREKLIKHLEGMYLQMACSRSGSHVLEKFYNLSSDQQKEVIVGELSERLNQLNGCVSGRIINYKFSCEAFARNQNHWRSLQARNAANN